jgi:hypothetical protein
VPYFLGQWKNFSHTVHSNKYIISQIYPALNCGENSDYKTILGDNFQKIAEVPN